MELYNWVLILSGLLFGILLLISYGKAEEALVRIKENDHSLEIYKISLRSEIEKHINSINNEISIIKRNLPWVGKAASEDTTSELSRHIDKIYGIIQKKEKR